MENGRQRGDHHSAGEPRIGGDVAFGDSDADFVEGFDVARQLIPTRLQRPTRWTPGSVELDQPLAFVQLTPVCVRD